MSEEGRKRRNLRAAVGLTESAWSEAFLTVCREKKLPAFDIPAESVLLSEIDVLYRESAEATRSRMKAGAAKAVAEYTSRGYSLDVLGGLATIVAFTRATEAVIDLASHVIALHPHLRHDAPPVYPVAVDLIHALGTFPRHPRVASLFRTLLFDDTVHFRFAGMLAISVVRNDPTAFVSAITRFYEQRSQGPDCFHDRTMMRAFFDAVLQPDLENALEQFDDTSQQVKNYVIEWGVKFKVLGLPSDNPEDDKERPADAGLRKYSTFKEIHSRKPLEQKRVKGLRLGRFGRDGHA